MKTAEEILEKHLSLMVGRLPGSYVSIEDMKKVPEWGSVINAMIEFAKLRVEACKKEITEIIKDE